MILLEKFKNYTKVTVLSIQLSSKYILNSVRGDGIIPKYM